MNNRRLLPYRESLAGNLLAAREAVMGPIRPILRDAGLTDQQWRVLRVLIDRGEIEPSRLAEEALLYAASVSRILRELLDRGLVDRRPDETDGRRSIIAPTAAGRLMVEQVSELTLLKFDLYVEKFGRARLDALRDELEQLVWALEPFQPAD